MLEGQHGLVGASYEVLETYRMFAHDRGWNRSLEEAVRTGLTAEAAVERVRSEHRARLGQARDPYLRERLHDLEDLADRLLRDPGRRDAGQRELPDDAILIARNLGPADLLEYDRTKLKGLLLEEGSAASHAAIVARALDIPCVGRLDRPARPGLRGRPGHRRRRDRRGLPAPAPGRGRGRPAPASTCAPSARPSSPSCATRRPSPATGRKITLLMNAGLAVDLENLRRDRAPRASACSAPSSSSWSPRSCRG